MFKEDITPTTPPSVNTTNDGNPAWLTPELGAMLLKEVADYEAGIGRTWTSEEIREKYFSDL
ncbi:MAG: hypothetical protein LBO69_01755 [Ignavibacteria bacterium]|jgi:hypothetical protein|nr:hypothetical protein [Ignavibacteria bacterium]